MENRCEPRSKAIGGSELEITASYSRSYVMKSGFWGSSIAERSMRRSQSGWSCSGGPCLTLHFFGLCYPLRGYAKSSNEHISVSLPRPGPHCPRPKPGLPDRDHCNMLRTILSRDDIGKYARMLPLGESYGLDSFRS